MHYPLITIDSKFHRSNLLFPKIFGTNSKLLNSASTGASRTSAQSVNKASRGQRSETLEALRGANRGKEKDAKSGRSIYANKDCIKVATKREKLDIRLQRL